jgi:hypothetical protein
MHTGRYLIRSFLIDLQLFCTCAAPYSSAMKIAKPMLLVTTPIGIIGGVYEGYRLAGGLVFLMVALLMMISAAIGMTVLTIRREEAATKRRAAATSTGMHIVRSAS